MFAGFTAGLIVLKPLEMLICILTSTTSAGDDTDTVIYNFHKFSLSANMLLQLASVFAALYPEHRSISPGHIDGRLLIS